MTGTPQLHGSTGRGVGVRPAATNRPAVGPQLHASRDEPPTAARTRPDQPSLAADSYDRAGRSAWVASATGGAGSRDPRAELDRLMMHLLEVWTRLRDRLADPATVQDMLRAGAALDGGGDVADEIRAIYARARDIGRSLATAAGGDEAKGETPAGADVASAPARLGRGAKPAAAAVGRDAGRVPANLGGDVAEFARLTMQIHAELLQRANALAGTSADGLTVVDPTTVRTERYEIAFESASTIRITDRSSGEWTRVWGDPHVDVSTIAGDRDGEFSDLTGSAMITTFKLQDGTTVRFEAPDQGVTEHVDVIRGDTQIRGTGVGPHNNYVGAFHQIGSASAAPRGEGDVVYAGADGASWYDAGGKLIWGRPSPASASAAYSQSLEVRARAALTTR